MEDNSIGWIIVLGVLTLIALTFIVLYFRATVTLLTPRECGAKLGEYAIQPSMTGNVLSICDIGDCIYPANNLSAAIDICNSDKDKCRYFSYNSSSKIMSYMETNNLFASPSGLTDLYLRYKE